MVGFIVASTLVVEQYSFELNNPVGFSIKKHEITQAKNNRTGSVLVSQIIGAMEQVDISGRGLLTRLAAQLISSQLQVVLPKEDYDPFMFLEAVRQSFGLRRGGNRDICQTIIQDPCECGIYLLSHS